LAEEREDAVKAVLVNSDVNINALERMQLNGQSFAGGISSVEDAVLSVGKQALGGATTLAAWAFVKTSLITIQNMAPNLQALILMSIYFLLPFILVMGSYQWKVIITATFVVFGIRFLTTIFALLHYLDTALFAATNQFSRNQLLNSASTSTLGAGVTDLALATMWLILPALWLGMIGWAGYRAASAVSTGSNEAKTTGDRGTQGASSAAK